MKKVSIFAIERIVEPTEILAVRYNPTKGKHIVAEVLAKWQDIQYLEDFFEKYKSDLESWNSDVENAIIKTINQMKAFIVRLKNAGNSGQFDNTIFKPLHRNDSFNNQLCTQSKAYGIENGSSWLRMYAIRLGENQYLITGGCIKLTQAMQDRPHTELELHKLKEESNYLKNQGFRSIEDGDLDLLEVEIL
jgi:hypothetical protein